jgi:hypothetical protein
VLDGLMACHSEGICYGDVKPASECSTPAGGHLCAAGRCMRQPAAARPAAAQPPPSGRHSTLDYARPSPGVLLKTAPIHPVLHPSLSPSTPTRTTQTSCWRATTPPPPTAPTPPSRAAPSTSR